MKRPSKTKPSSPRPSRSSLVWLAALLAAPAVPAATLYWDGNGATAGAGATPAGSWRTSGMFSGSSGGSLATSNSLTTAFDTIVFSAGTDATGAYQVSLSNVTQNARLVIIEEGTPTFLAGTLMLGTGGGITVATGAGNPTLSGNLTITGADTLAVGTGRTLTLDNNGAFFRGLGAVLGVQGTVNSTEVFFSSNLSTGIVGTWATAGTGANTRYATFSGSSIVGLTGTAAADASALGNSPLTNYNLALATGTAPATVSANTIRYTGSGGTTTPGATSFTVNGLLNAGTGTWTIGSTPLTIGSDQELVVNAANSSIVLGSVIQNNSAGASSLTVTGPLLVTLTGANTYTGGTNITGGTLQVGAGGTTGALGSGTVLNQGSLLFNRSDAITVSNTISGSGAVGLQAGAGLTLDGNNTYTGGTTVAAGTLRVSTNDSALGTGPLTFTGSATLATAPGGGARSLANRIVINPGAVATFGSAAADLTLNGLISGAGTLASTSTGTLSLNGANTYTGPTVIGTSTSAGLVSIISIQNAGSTIPNSLGIPAAGAASVIGINDAGGLRYTGATAGSSNRVINLLSATGGAYRLNASGDALFALSGGVTNSATSGTTTVSLFGVGVGTQSGVIDNGSGTSVTALTKGGAGTWILTGANTYTGLTTISTGTLQIGVGAMQGSSGGNTGTLGSGPVTNNATLAFNRYDTVTVPNAISGPGSVVQLGSAGTTILTGTNTYTGATSIRSGTLQVLDQGNHTGLADNSPIVFEADPATGYAGGTFEYVTYLFGGTESVGALQVNAGAATVKVTVQGSSNTLLNFASFTAPAAGTGLNFVAISQTVGFAAAPTDGFLNAHAYYGGKDFAISTAGLPGAPNYNITAGFVSAASALTADKHILINASFTQNSVQVRSLKFATTQTLTLNAGQTLTINTGANTAGGILVTGGSTAAITGGAGLTTGGNQDLVIRLDGSSDTLTLGTPISSTTTGGLTKNGTGSLTLTAANAQTGATTINEGSVKLSGSGTLGNVANPLTVRVDGTLDLNGTSQTVGDLSGSGLIRNSSTSALSTLTVNSTAGSTFSGALVDGSTAGNKVLALTKTGPGTLTLNAEFLAPNNYSGSTNIFAGVLAISASTDLGKSSAVTNSVNLLGGTLRVTAEGAVNLGPRNLFFNNSGGTIDTSLGNVTTIGGGINSTGGAGAELDKTGLGTLVLSAGTTNQGIVGVKAGTLQLNGNLSQTTVNVVSGATFGGSGTTGTVDVQGGAAVSPGGAPGAGTLGATDLFQLEAGATYLFDAGLTSDLVQLTGAGTQLTFLGAWTLRLTDLGLDPRGLTFTLFDGQNTSGSSFGTPTIDYGLTGWSGGVISFDSATNNLVLTGVIPEPLTGGSVLAGASLLLGLRRRRRGGRKE